MSRSVMSTTASLRFGDLGIVGTSTAGLESWFRVSPPGVAFDAGRGAAALSGVRHLFLTHGHLDHALGIPFQLSQRNFEAAGPSTRIFCPRPAAAELRRFVEAAEALERVSYSYEIEGLEPGDRVDLGRGYSVEAFATDHVVPSLGFHLRRRRKQLAPAFVGRSHEELARLRSEGVEIDESHEVLALSYSGDTSPSALDAEPALFSAEVLLVECTFLGDRMARKGALYKHVHVDDLIERRERFANRWIVLFHLSRRHRPAELREILEREAPEIAARVVLFPAEAQREAQSEDQSEARREAEGTGAGGEAADER